MALVLEELTEQIIGTFYDVYNELGPGFLEKVYEKSFEIALRKKGLKVERQKKIVVHFQGYVVGEYFADLVVEDKVILELKAAETISKMHTAQLVNYLKATVYEVGYVFNFGPEPAYERRYFPNRRKKHFKNPR